MRTISEMYKRSGGTKSPAQCKDCWSLVKNGKTCSCRLHSDDAIWNPDWYACRFFHNKIVEQVEGQLSVFDCM